MQRRPFAAASHDADGAPALWFVKVTLGGQALDSAEVRAALERLTLERAFVTSARYGDDCAEVRYWDECRDADEAVRQALALWGDDEVAFRLPGWKVLGLEVLDRSTARRQAGRGDHPAVVALGEVVPFD